MSLFDDLDAQNEVEKSPYRQAFNQGNVVVGPDGEDLSLPPNTGAANLYGGATPPASPSHRPKKNLFLELDAMEENRGPVEGIGDGNAQDPSMTPRRRMIPVGSVNPFDNLDGITPTDDLPQVRDSVADSIGLQRWRDVNDGTEIRRAQPATKSIPEQGAEELPAKRNPFDAFLGEWMGGTQRGVISAASGYLRQNAAPATEINQADGFNPTATTNEATTAFDKSIADQQSALGRLQGIVVKKGFSTADDDRRIKSLQDAIAFTQNQKDLTLKRPEYSNQEQSNLLQRRESSKQDADSLDQISKGNDEFWGVNRKDTSVAAQVGRGLGSVNSMVPSMLAPGGSGLILAAVQGASSSYDEAYDSTRDQLQKAGVTDQKTIDDAASQAGSTAATKTFPALAAYMVGGKITAAGVSALLKGASPLVKGIVGGTAASGANVVTSAGIRAAEGEDWKPTAEGLTQDIAFGAIHGAGEYNQAKVTREQEAQRFNENPGQTRSFPGDNSQNQRTATWLQNAAQERINQLESSINNDKVVGVDKNGRPIIQSNAKGTLSFEEEAELQFLKNNPSPEDIAKRYGFSVKPPITSDNSQNRQNPVENAPKQAENAPPKATDGNDWTTATDPEEGEAQAPITPERKDPSIVTQKEGQDLISESSDLNSGIESPDGKYGENNPIPQNRKQVESTIKGLDNGEYHIYIDGEHEYTLHVITSKKSGRRSYQLESPVNGHSLGIGSDERLGDVAPSLMWQSGTTQSGERIWSKPELYKSGTTPEVAKAEPPIEQKITPTPSEEAMEKHGLAWADPKTLKLSEDVPNFKEGADEKTGIVEADRLKGTYDPEAAGILHVWERLDGKREIISGRHRWQLALENNTPEVLVKIHREADGFTKEDALKKDAQLNIKDEKGTTKDFAAYFRNDPITREEAEAGGLLSRVKQNNGFQIGRYSSGDLYGLFSAGKISEAKAAAIARTAPNNDGLQRAGMDAAGRMSAEEIPGFMKLLEMATSPKETQAGLFGDDDSAIQDSIRISKAAAKKAEELQEQILAVKGAAKRPEAAAKLGVNVKDPEGLQKKILDLSMQRERYRSFWQHPDILEELSGKSPKQEEDQSSSLADTDTATGSLFGEDSTPTIQKNGEGNLFRGDEIEFNLSGETDRSSLTPEEQKAKALDEAMAAENQKNQGSLFDETPKQEQATEEVTANTRTINRDYKGYPKGTQVEIIGKASKDPLNTEIQIRFPDGKTDSFPEAWLKKPKTAQTKPKQTLPQLLKERGRDAVNELLGEWNDAELSADGTYIMGVVDPRSSMKPERIPVREFLDWLQDKESQEPPRETRKAETEQEAKERGEVADKEAKDFEEKQFPTTREEVQSQLDSLSEKRQQEAKAKKKGLEDFGEKIGGARKDTATKGGRGTSKPQDDRPGWARRYEIREEMKQSERAHLSGRTDVEIDPFEKARFRIVDLRNLDWMKQPKQVGRETFATREEAEKAIPLIAVARNHSARMMRKEGIPAPTTKPSFSTREEAEKWAEAHKDDYVFQIWRKVTDRKLVQVVKEDFPTREAAMEYMAKNAKDIIEAKTAWREELIVKPENAVRTGAERRQGPATPEMFQDTFGFRGVEFGNWMRQDTGSKERQEVLNNAYDGLRDLAEILGVPDKAMSLNGDLALAFGARGQGLQGARAHYEPEYGVINLTKMSGAGTLAHEWFHAFDHYLARQAGKAPAERVSKGGNLVYPDRGFVSEGFGLNPKVRPEVQEAFETLIQTIRNKALKFVEDSKKAEDFVESTKKRLADKLVELRRNLESTLQYGSKKAPATAKQLARFDELAGKLLDGTDVKTEFRYNDDGTKRRAGRLSLSGRWSNDTMDAMAALWKEVRGRSGFKSDKNGAIDNLYSYVRNYADRIEILKSAAAEDVKTKTIPTSFRMEATKIDQGSASDYWSKELELAARAFSSYVEDKIANGGARSEFLSYGSDNELPGYKMWGLKPFPEGEERLAINAAMDRLFRTLKTKETEKGTAFYSHKENEQAELTRITDPDISSLDERDTRLVGRADAARAISILEGKLEEEARNAKKTRTWRASSGDYHDVQDSPQIALAGAVARLFGRELVVFKATGSDAPNGVVNGSLELRRFIFLNEDHDKPVFLTLGHELWHSIHTQAPLLAESLRRELRPMMNKGAIREAKVGLYGEEHHENEAIGDLLGDMLSDPRRFNDLAQRNKSLARKVVDVVQKWLSKVANALKEAGYGSNKFFRDIEEARDRMADVLAKFSEAPFSDHWEFVFEPRDSNESYYSKKTPQENLLAAMDRHQAAPPLSMREKVASSLRRINGVVKDLPEFGDFKKEVLKWSARSQRSANEILRVQGQIEEAVPSKEKRDGITNWIQANGDQGLLRSWANATKNKTLKAGYEAALKLTPEEIATAKKIKDSYDILHNRAKKFGIDMGYLPNYVTELWKQEPQRAAGSSPKRLSEFFKFSQERVFPNYFEGEQAGYEPQTKDISKLLGLYMNEMNNAINSRRFVQELSKGTASDGRPLVSARGSGQEVGEDVGDKVHLVYPDKAAEGTEDYKKLDQPALHGWVFAGKDADGSMILVKGDLAVHPEIATHFKNALGSSKIRQWWNEKTANPFLNATKGTAKFILDDLQGAVKGTMLSFSPFHQVQEGIHALGHRINPFGNIPKIDLRRPDQMDAVEHGLMLSHDRLSQHLFMEGVGTNNRNLVTGLIRKVGFKPGRLAADRVDAYQDWLFGHYIPGLKFKTYEHILDRNMERYAKDLANGKASPSQVKLLSARQANAAYGHLNYTDMGHNPTIRHAFQVVLLAPDFLEARARFTGQAIKGLAGGKVGSEQLQALAFLAATQFILARVLNKLENDDYEWAHPFEVKVGNKLYGLRSVPEDIYKLFGNTAGFIGGRISPIFGRLIQEGLFGVNYRGEHTTWGDALKDIVAGIVPMPFQGLTKNLTPGGRSQTINPMEQILSATGLQVHRYSPISATYQLARKWTDANDPDDAKARGRYPVSKYQGLRYALEDGDFQAAKAEVRKLQAKGQKLQDIREGFKGSVDHPFTGTKLNDIRFERSLAGHDKEIFKAAVERRRIILQRFGQALR